MTNIGAGREKNQDAIGIHVFEREGDKHMALAVADGLGFYEYSELAAYEAVNLILSQLAQGKEIAESCEAFHRQLLLGYPYAEKAHHQASPPGIHPEEEDLGSTTLVLADICGDKLKVALVGDSRLYLFRKGALQFRTRDQAMIELLVSQKILDNDPLLLRRHPLRSVLLNALGGPEPTYKFEAKGEMTSFKTGLPQIFDMNLQKGDFIILATDGFYTNLSEEEMIAIVTKTSWKDVSEKFSKTIRHVFEKKETIDGFPSNPDNFSFIVYRHL